MLRALLASGEQFINVRAIVPVTTLVVVCGEGAVTRVPRMEGPKRRV